MAREDRVLKRMQHVMGSLAGMPLDPLIAVTELLALEGGTLADLENKGFVRLLRGYSSPYEMNHDERSAVVREISLFRLLTARKPTRNAF
jgi:hypothetical protein